MLVFFLFSAVLLTGGCASAPQKEAQDPAVSVVATIFAPYDFARALTDGLSSEVKLTMLLKPGAEAHTYDPTPQDIITIQNADVFIYVGGESDVWVDTILNSVDVSDMQIIRMMDCVSLYEEEAVLDTQREQDDDGSSETEWDEHVWTDPQNALQISRAIANALQTVFSERKDPRAASQTERNMQEYAAQLCALDEAFREAVSEAESTVMVFGDRYPLRYFSEAYGLSYYAAFPGCSTESEPSAGTMAFLIDFVREEKIKTVFRIELSNGNIARAIAEDTNAAVRTFYTCHTISKEDFEQGETYLSLMWKNVAVLKEALN